MAGCSITLTRLDDEITGRTDDMMIVRAVNVFPTQIEEIILIEPELTPHYQCHLDREGNLDTLLVKVERHESVPPASAAAAGYRVAARVKHLIGIRIAVEVTEPHAIERSAGKMRRIIDHRESL